MTKKEFLAELPFTYKDSMETFKYTDKRIYKRSGPDQLWQWHCAVPIYSTKYFEAFNILFGKGNSAIVFFKDCKLVENEG